MAERRRRLRSAPAGRWHARRRMLRGGSGLGRRAARHRSGSTFLAAWPRSEDIDSSRSSALYDDRSLLHLIAMRRAVFVVPGEVPAVLAGASNRCRPRARRQLLALLVAGGMPATDGWLAGVEEVASTSSASRRGHAGRPDRRRSPPRHQRRARCRQPQRGDVKIASRLLTVRPRATRRGRPKGRGRRPVRWAALGHWAPSAAATMATRRARGPARPAGSPASARHGRGPGVVDRGKSRGPAGRSPRRHGRGRPGRSRRSRLAADVEPAPGVEPWARCCPRSTPRRWAGRAGWYLGGHGQPCSTPPATPAPRWWDGRIVGGWAQVPNGEIPIRLLETSAPRPAQALKSQADRGSRPSSAPSP